MESTEITSEMRKYLEAAEWAEETKREMVAATEAFHANRNDDTRWNLSVAIQNWHRDLDIRMKRGDQLNDAEYSRVMRMRREAKAS